MCKEQEFVIVWPELARQILHCDVELLFIEEGTKFHGLTPCSILMIRWCLVIHGCIDRFSRRIIYLHCSSNNLSSTVLTLFLNATEKDGELLPSRIQVDQSVGNVLVCEAVVEKQGGGRASFIAGPSTHNQRIERLWRDYLI